MLIPLYQIIIIKLQLCHCKPQSKKKFKKMKENLKIGQIWYLRHVV